MTALHRLISNVPEGLINSTVAHEKIGHDPSALASASVPGSLEKGKNYGRPRKNQADRSVQYSKFPPEAQGKGASTRVSQEKIGHDRSAPSNIPIPP